MMYKLKIISATVRPGRKGPVIAKWIADIARRNEEFEVELLDLGEVKLPMMDEPNHPSLQKYQHQHTKDWSAKINSADAFIFVTGEYNFGYPAPLRNALEYLQKEWAYKAAGIVSYGGISAGTRAANSLKGDLATLKIVPLADAVFIPFFAKLINEQNEFVPGEISLIAADNMLKELLRWTRALKTMRE
ncbi:NAD(P)H-dependent oxidoreductase [Pedobacter nutrimenti]|uniref:NADPH-dependent FMN reductase n=1 Tax=Pedobacter nutrimenti TaxID=1241337 RepID=UPI00292D31EC|nr:NAD(P)H-dependent oxidoreductase [Pedobacter nutrimenti]